MSSTLLQKNKPDFKVSKNITLGLDSFEKIRKIMSAKSMNFSEALEYLVLAGLEEIRK